MQLGDLVAILMLTAFLYDPISRLHQLNQLVQAGRAAGERVFEILDEDAEPGVVAGVGDSGAAITDRGYSARIRRRHSLRKRQLQLRRRIICAYGTFRFTRDRARRLRWSARLARENRRW